MAVEFEERSIRANDGTKLHFHRWTPAEGDIRAELLVLHGYLEHGARYREFAHHVVPHGVAVSTVDYRGHGKAEGVRGYVESYDDYFRDVDAALEQLPAAGPRFLLGHSNGGLIALNYVPQRQPDLRGLVLTNPYLEVAVAVPYYKILLGNVAARLYPKLAVPTGIPSSGLSRDLSVGEAYDRDPLVFKSATAGWFAASQLAQAQAKSLTRLGLPFMYVYSDSDPIALPEANRVLAGRLQGDDKTVVLREGGRHELLNETDRHELYDMVRDWVLARA